MTLLLEQLPPRRNKLAQRRSAKTLPLFIVADFKTGVRVESDVKDDEVLKLSSVEETRAPSTFHPPITYASSRCSIFALGHQQSS